MKTYVFILFSLFSLFSLFFFSQSIFAKKNVEKKETKTVTEIVIKKIVFSSEAGKLNFSAVGKPAMIKIIGKGPGPEGEINYSENKISGTLTFDLSQLNTGIDLRDDHLKNKYLEIGTYPKATLEIKDHILSKAVDLIDGSEISETVKGIMTVHGKSNPIEVQLVIKKDKINFIVKGDFVLKIMDYLSTLPSYAGLKVADEVTINLETKSK